MGKLWNRITKPFRRHAEWWNNYLTEISILVISLGATYYGDRLIENYLERIDDREAIGMVRNELVSNIAELNNIDRYYQKEVQLSETFAKATQKRMQVEEDSIKQFYNQHRLYYYWFMKNSAFDMVRESGTVQRIDKTLLTQLFECYEQMEVVEDMGENYRKTRMSELLLLAAKLPDGQYAETTSGQWKQIDRDQKFRQYLLTSLPMMAKSARSVGLETRKLVQDMLETLDQYYPPGD